VDVLVHWDFSDGHFWVVEPQCCFGVGISETCDERSPSRFGSSEDGGEWDARWSINEADTMLLAERQLAGLITAEGQTGPTPPSRFCGESRPFLSNIEESILDHNLAPRTWSRIKNGTLTPSSFC
jgi:hypothetical protein